MAALVGVCPGVSPKQGLGTSCVHRPGRGGRALCSLAWGTPYPGAWHHLAAPPPAEQPTPEAERGTAAPGTHCLSPCHTGQGTDAAWLDAATTLDDLYDLVKRCVQRQGAASLRLCPKAAVGVASLWQPR